MCRTSVLLVATRPKLKVSQQVSAALTIAVRPLWSYRPIFKRLILLISRVADGKKPLGMCVDSQVDSGFARKLLIQ